MLVLIKITYCVTHTQHYKESSWSLKIRSAGHMRPAGLSLDHTGLKDHAFRIYFSTRK